MALGRPQLSSTADFAANQHPAYVALLAAVDEELTAIRRQDPRAGVGMRHTHRLFDRQWLQAAQARFELVAVVPRLDRWFVDPRSCGEIRLIYRLAYQWDHGTDGWVDARLPFSINAVYRLAADEQHGHPCRAQVEAWSRDEGPASVIDQALSRSGCRTPGSCCRPRVRLRRQNRWSHPPRV